jgi:lipopolysaccharide transport system permease protein
VTARRAGTTAVVSGVSGTGLASPSTIIRPSGARPNLGEVWAYRELLYFLVWRDLKVRYKQTVLGIAWAVLQPLATTLVFAIFLGRLAGVPSDGVPYPVFAYAAMLPWQLFAHALTESSNSLVANERLITKVYFPRLVIPLATILAGLIDFAIAFVVGIGLMAWYGIVPGPLIAAVPLFVVLAVLTALAAGLWLSALNVEYRDVRYTLGFLVQIWLFATPVAYPSSLVPERWRALYGLNPMAGVVEGFRWALLGHGQPPGALLVVSTVVTFVVLAGGLWYFKRMERTFADVV